MFARGEFRHHAAVFGVQLNLRRNRVGQNFSVAHDGGAGFVAGSFNGQNGHGGIRFGSARTRSRSGTTRRVCR